MGNVPSARWEWNPWVPSGEQLFRLGHCHLATSGRPQHRLIQASSMVALLGPIGPSVGGSHRGASPWLVVFNKWCHICDADELPVRDGCHRHRPDGGPALTATLARPSRGSVPQGAGPRRYAQLDTKAIPGGGRRTLRSIGFGPYRGLTDVHVRPATHANGRQATALPPPGRRRKRRLLCSPRQPNTPDPVIAKPVRFRHSPATVTSQQAGSPVAAPGVVHTPSEREGWHFDPTRHSFRGPFRRSRDGASSCLGTGARLGRDPGPWWVSRRPRPLRRSAADRACNDPHR